MVHWDRIKLDFQQCSMIIIFFPIQLISKSTRATNLIFPDDSTFSLRRRECWCRTSGNAEASKRLGTLAPWHHDRAMGSSVPAVNELNGKDSMRTTLNVFIVFIIALKQELAELKTTANVGVKVPLAHSLCCTPTLDNILRVLQGFLLSRAWVGYGTKW